MEKDISLKVATTHFTGFELWVEYEKTSSSQQREN